MKKQNEWCIKVGINILKIGEWGFLSIRKAKEYK
jgi:hypothetical protein